VYKITCTVNSKLYIGITKKGAQKRFEDHMKIRSSGAPRLMEAVKEFGPENFTLEVIDTTDNYRDLCKKEIFYIKKFNSNDERFGLNILKGGQTSEYAAMKTRRKIRDLSTGKVYDSLTDAAEHTGIPKEMISFVLRGRQDTTYGKKFEYVDADLRKETQEKRLKRINKKQETIKPIIDVKTGVVYESIAEASEKTGLTKNAISRHLRGVSLTRGFIFLEFYKDKKSNTDAEQKRKEREHREYVKNKKSEIICLKTGKVFKNAKEAATDINGTIGQIHACARGHLLTYKGFYLIYTDPEKRRKAEINKNKRKEEAIETKIRVGKIKSRLLSERTSKPVKCLETGKIFKSKKECYLFLGVSKKVLSRAMKSNKKINDQFTVVEYTGELNG
jgi:group I intron endonuclease